LLLVTFDMHYLMERVQEIGALLGVHRC
jgi:hypothetical protein